MIVNLFFLNKMVNIDKFSVSVLQQYMVIGRLTNYDLHTIQILYKEKGGEELRFFDNLITKT